MPTQFEIGVIGAGNAAEGIVHGLLRNTVLLDDRIIASDPHAERRELFHRRFNIAVTDDNRKAVEQSYILILAVKPQQYVEVCRGFADLVRDDHVIVSIMAGVSTASIEAAFSRVPARIIRVMPNLPMHVGAGMACLFRGRHAHEADLLRAQRIFEAGGRSIVLEEESQLDAVTAISGSGPAYYYYFTEALIEAGVKAGLSRQHAQVLAKQTCFGAARMMLESGESPDLLRRKVMSPGGTTQAALECMDEAGVFQCIVDGALAAWKRSQELGR